MVYDRASEMYAALRDVVGDTAFTRFLRGYYARWGMKHVDEEAMRAEVERAWDGRDLSWFFAQWVHGVDTYEDYRRFVAAYRAAA